MIVASHNGRDSLAKCLTAIHRQRDRGVKEIIVVDNSTDGSAAIVRREFPSVILVTASVEKLIPELWGIGIAKSTGEIVALTTSHFVPANTWIYEILSAHETEEAGVGGAIENEESSGLVSWAVYFCRYSPYMLPFRLQGVEDFAADNASYKRRDLDRVKETMSNGFWETFVHREMRSRGMSLSRSPRILVKHQKSFSFSGFMNQRFYHGRQFGESRGGAMSAGRRAGLAMLSPLIPFVYMLRIGRQVFGKRRNISKLLVSSPVLVMFLLSWSAGEFTGYLSRRGR